LSLICRKRLDLSIKKGTVYFSFLALFGLLSSFFLPVSTLAQSTSDPLIELPGSLSPDIGSFTLLPQNNTATKLVSSVSIVLTPRNERQLETFVQNVQNPNSPEYRKFLTVEQFKRLYSPDVQLVMNLKNFFTKKGLTITYESPDHLLIVVNGPNTELDKAFGTISEYHINTNGDKGFINVQPLKLPASIAKGIKGVTGFDRLHKPKHFLRGNFNILNSTTSGPNTPNTLRTAYNITQTGLDGSGTSVGIILDTAPDINEVKRWASYYNLPTPNVNVVGYGGNTSLEANLDVQMVLTAAPATNIRYYVANSGSDGGVNFSYLLNSIKQAIYDQVNVISNSWGYCESYFDPQTRSNYHSVFQNAAALGIPILFSSGDSGIFQCSGFSNSIAGEGSFPAVDDLVTAVGGTKLLRDSNTNAWGDEFGWSCNDVNDNTTCIQAKGGSSGGGVSQYSARPYFQTNINPTSESGNISYDSTSPNRVIPDISLDADPVSGVLIFQNNCDPTVNCPLRGGTSASTPLLAGVIALASQKIGGQVGGINPFIYANCSGSFWCYDVTNGYNGVNAKQGWDYLTGLGSLKDVNTFIQAFTDPAWQTYTSANSPLPSDYINVITLDKDGSKWIGTYGGGLAHFDGTNWTIYTTANSGLPSNDIHAITIDNDGTKWISTAYGGVAHFDGTTWTVYNSSNSPLPVTPNINGSIFGITIDQDGSKWFGTVNGVAHFDGTTWAIYDSTNSGLPGGVNEIAIDKDGSKWFTTQSGVVHFDGANWTVYNHANSGLPNDAIISVAIDSNGMKWFGGYNVGEGVTTFDGTNWKNYNTGNSGLPSNWVQRIIIGPNGEKWFAAVNGGAAKFDGSNWTVYNTSNSGIVSNAINSIAIDKNGNELFGTTSGLSILNNAAQNLPSINFLTLPFPYDPKMNIQQGWFYNFTPTSAKCTSTLPNPDNNPINNLNCGIDYIKGTKNGSDWVSFPVLAAADGTACWNCISPREGNAVWITHTTIHGMTYNTYYGNLMSSPLPADGSPKPVKRGDIIGYAGNTGTNTGFYLHFDLRINNVSYDPYGIWSTADKYPTPNCATTPSSQAEATSYWTTNPPSFSINTVCVNVNTDNGTGNINGTLSNAITQTTAGQTIALNIPGGVLTLTGPLPPLKQGVNLSGGSCSSEPSQAINANSIEGPVFELMGQNTIENIQIYNRKGVGLEVLSTNNVMRCTVIKP